MVEQSYRLDSIFSSLGDPTRRDILHRVSEHTTGIGEIAKHYNFSFAGIAKHLDVLERAGLVRKTKTRERADRLCGRQGARDGQQLSRNV